MNISEYLIFRHTISERKELDVVWDQTKQPVTAGQIEEELLDYISVFSNLYLHGTTCFVSGGLDSSLLAAMLKPETIYVASFPGFKYDELQWADKVAKHIGANLRVVTIEKGEYFSVLKELIKRKGDGLHPNEPCLYLVAKQMKKDGFNQVFSGEGADGLFGGYTDLLEKEQEYMINVESFLKRYAYVMPEKNYIPFNIFKRWGMYQFILRVHTPGLIARAENACNAADMVVHFPYLDTNVLQMMVTAPADQKKNKNILKKVAEKYLPKEIINREKVGFPVPLDEWYGGIEEFLKLNVKIWQSLK